MDSHSEVLVDDLRQTMNNKQAYIYILYVVKHMTWERFSEIIRKESMDTDKHEEGVGSMTIT